MDKERSLLVTASGFLLSSVLVLTGCGGGGGATSSASSSNGGPSGQFSLTGLVFEGAAVPGATVCLSNAGTGSCDSGGSTVQTGKTGIYTLTGIVSVNNNAQLVAQVPAYTDPTTNVQVDAHQLTALVNGSSQLSAGKHALVWHSKASNTPITVNISPFATMVAQRVFNYGVSVSTAATDVANSIGNGVQPQQLLGNYLSTNLLQQLGLVLGGQFGVVFDTVQSQLKGSLTPGQQAQATLLAANLAGSNLLTTTQQVQPNAPVTQQEISSFSSQTSNINSTNVLSLLAAVSNSATAVSSSYATTLNGLYGLALGWDGTNYTVPAYVTYKVDSSGNGTSSLFDFANGVFSATTLPHTQPANTPYQYILINNAWVPYGGLFQDTLGGELGLQSFQLVSASGQNNLLYKGTAASGPVTASAAQGLPVTMNSVPVANLSIASFLSNAFSGDTSLLSAYKVVGSNALFPANATAYTLSITPGATIPSYEVLTRAAGMNALTVSNSVGTQSTLPVTSLASLISIFTTGSTQYLYLAQDTSNGYFLQFAPGATSGSGNASIYTFARVNSTTGGAPSFNVGSATPISIAYVTNVVNGVSMLQITPPSGTPFPSILGSNSALIFAVDPTSQVDMGWQVSSSQTQNLEEYFFDSTALNAIKAAGLCPPTSTSTSTAGC